jgi:hypothetical protein
MKRKAMHHKTTATMGRTERLNLDIREFTAPCASDD